jgi:Glycosyl hydrolase family 79 C-terminal beta domain
VTRRFATQRRGRAAVCVRRVLLIGFATVLLATLETACGQAATSHAAPTQLSVKVGGVSSAPRVAPGYVGISTEVKNLLVYAGTSPADLDQPFLQLLRNLAPGSTPILRIAGDSTDWSWWPVPGMARPGGATYSLTPAWASVAKRVATAVHGKEIIGVNFEADSKRVATYEAQQLTSHIGAGQVEAFELGNEPELYSGFGWYKNSAGEPVYGRPKSYDLSAYTSDWGSIASGLSGFPVAGPSTGSAAWLPDLSPFLSADHSHLKLVTVHAYPLRHCSKTTVNHPSDLLASASLGGLVSAVTPSVTDARHYGLPVRLDEINSVTCGGELGVTNSFAAALWALNLLPLLDRAGIVGVNFQTVPKTWQSMINASQSKTGWQVQVQPVYYGLATFAEAAPAGSRFLQVSSPSISGMFEWATKATNGEVHVVLSNGTTTTRTLHVTVPGEHGNGVLALLKAPSIGSTGGVTIAGQTFSATTGSLTGTPNATQLKPSAGGVYSVTVPGSSAAVLTLGGSPYAQS